MSLNYCGTILVSNILNSMNLLYMHLYSVLGGCTGGGGETNSEGECAVEIVAPVVVSDSRSTCADTEIRNQSG